MTRAGIYSRQSRDSTKSIDDQTRENRDVAKDQDWEVVAEYSDGTSASRFAKKRRDDWERVLADIGAHAWDVLILWESSRGDRTPESWFAFLSLCRDRGVLIHVTSHERTYDVRKRREWRTLAEDGIDSADESEKIAVRVRRGLASSAAAGMPTHGRCPYGYRRIYDERTGELLRQEPDPETAPVVREVVERISRGDPVSSITDDFNARKVPTPGARTWYRARVRDLASNPVYRAARVHNGVEYKATWPALVDDVTWYAAQRVLSDPRRLLTRPGRQVHLLSYLGVCGVCEGDWRGRGPEPGPLTAVKGRYKCLVNGCVTIVQADTDEMVTEAVLGRLTTPDVFESLRRDDADDDREALVAREEGAKLRAQLDGWRLSAAKGQTSPESLAVIEAELSAAIRTADRKAERASIPPALRLVLEPGVDVRARWESLTIPARRDIIRALAVITVRPADLPGSRTFDAWRLAGSRWVGDEMTWGEHWAA